MEIQVNIIKHVKKWKIHRNLDVLLCNSYNCNGVQSDMKAIIYAQTKSQNQTKLNSRHFSITKKLKINF